MPADPASALPEGVLLTRLIALARLTAPQALEVCAGVLAEVAKRWEPDTGSPGSDPVTLDQAVIGADGRVLLGPAPDGGHSERSPAVKATGPTLAALLAEVTGAARLPGRPADPAAEQLLAALDRAAAALPGAGVPGVARKLQETAAAIDRTAVRTELAALVRAVGGGAVSANGTGLAGKPSAVGRAAPAARATKGENRAAIRRIGAWVLSVLVLAVVVLLEVALMRDNIATDVSLLLDAGRSGSTSSTAPKPDGLPIVAPAPAAAGSVAGVDLRPLAQCAPGAPCTLRLLVRLVPGGEPQVVTWSYRIVDRCTGATTTAPGGSVAVPAGGERAATVGTVALPALQAVAVLAVTDVPAAAASRPVFAGSCLPDRSTQ